jgi:excisionase family DNA binding protein
LPLPARSHTLMPMQRIRLEIPKDWLSVADICEYMGVSTFVVTRLLRAEELPGVKFGREWRVARQDFEDWLNARRGAAAEAHEEPAATGTVEP